jgi:hypothetical protein
VKEVHTKRRSLSELEPAVIDDVSWLFSLTEYNTAVVQDF